MKKPRKKKIRLKEQKTQQLHHQPKMLQHPPDVKNAQGRPSPHKSSFWRAVEICAALVGLLGFAYLAYDVIYQASPEFDVSSSENKSPFSLPFMVKTQSILFKMHKARFTCSFDMVTTTGGIVKDTIIKFGGDLEIDRLNPGNYFCRNQIPANIIKQLTAAVYVEYCTQLWRY